MDNLNLEPSLGRARTERVLVINSWRHWTWGPMPQTANQKTPCSKHGVFLR
jgi:hypothetical protein